MLETANSTDSKKAISRALVTGAGGFIGTSLITKLVREGVFVIAVGHRPFELPVSCRKEILDLSCPGALDPFLTDDTTIFHLAARASVPQSVEDPRLDFSINLANTFEVLESARTAKAKVIFPSTASIFDSTNPLPLSERGIVRPSSPYGASKAACEAYCFAYSHCYNVDIRIVRLFSVYGVGMKQFAIYDIIKKIEKTSAEISIVGDGSQIRDYLYIDDCIEGLITICQYGKSGEDYHLADGNPVTILELTKKIASLMGVPDIPIISSKENRRGDTQWFSNVSKIRQLGFHPKTALQEGLVKTIAWVKQKETPLF